MKLRAPWSLLLLGAAAAAAEEVVLFKLEDPRRLIITWLVDGVRLGRMARGG